MADDRRMSPDNRPGVDRQNFQVLRNSDASRAYNMGRVSSSSTNSKWNDEDFAAFTAGGKERPVRQKRPKQKKNNDRHGGRKKPPKEHRKLKIALRILGVLALVAITAILCITLVFKLETINITGDLVYENEEILKICNYKKGDNLFFIDTSEKEAELKEKLPYIKEAKIKRKLPHTLEIQITGASLIGSVENNGQYLYVDDRGKIIDISSEPRDGIMTITGLDVESAGVGTVMQVQNPEVGEAYVEIAETINEQEAEGEFTKLDLSDLHNIKMSYQDRIEFELGNAADLAYKVGFGLNIARTKLEPTERGKLNLSILAETNSAPFDKDYSVKEPQPVGDSEGEGTGDSEGTKTVQFANNPGRGDDIPNRPYGAPEEDVSDASDSGSDNNNDDDYYDDSDDDYYSDDYDSGEDADEDYYYDDEYLDEDQ